jgi:gluconolactonase
MRSELAASAGRAPFTAHSEEFEAVLGDSADLVLVVTTDAHEGPVYVADEDALYFTTLPRPSDIPLPGTPIVQVKRVALDGEHFPVDPSRVSVLCASTRAANGMALDRDGVLVICEQGTLAQAARIARCERHTGELETVIDGWGGLPLNSPNDVVVRSDGSIWFTDPSYGYLQGFRPEPVIGDYVYRYDPRTECVAVVADSFEKPNGLAFSPDERTLYVTDSGANQEAGSFHPGLPHHIVEFDVDHDRRLSGQRLLAVTTPGFPDGLKLDADGRVYASSYSGV